MTAYYNEIEPYAAQWLRNLSNAGHIATGHVDERSIKDVTHQDLAGRTQCHFFAGIGVWSYALRLAGWPNDRPVWTGSCPCQPFSSAGKQRGFSDERHLWPNWFYLIQKCHPPVIFGEQVASPDGLKWLDLVSSDLEREGYAFAAADLCAASVGAPHIRQRLYFVAYATNARQLRCQDSGTDSADTSTCSQTDRWRGSRIFQPERDSNASDLANSLSAGRTEGRTGTGDRSASGGSSACELANTDSAGLQRERQTQPAERQCDSVVTRSGPVGGFWADAEWVPCIDEKTSGPVIKWRPVEPSSFPLADGAPSRVGRLRAYGNALVAPVAATFVKAFLDVLNE